MSDMNSNGIPDQAEIEVHHEEHSPVSGRIHAMLPHEGQDHEHLGSLSYVGGQGQPLHIENVTVRPQYRGIGVGKSLLNGLKSVFPNEDLHTEDVSPEGQQMFDSWSRQDPSNKVNVTKPGSWYGG